MWVNHPILSLFCNRRHFLEMTADKIMKKKVQLENDKNDFSFMNFDVHLIMMMFIVFYSVNNYLLNKIYLFNLIFIFNLYK